MVVDDSRFSSTKAFETTQSIKERTNDEGILYIFTMLLENFIFTICIVTSKRKLRF